MRNTLFLLIYWITLPVSGSSASDIKSFCVQADAFFMRYVSAGRVDYLKLSGERSGLDSLIGFIHDYDYTGETETSRKAYLINAYNLFVIDCITRNYPVDSPRDIHGFYNSQKHALSKKRITLDELEKDSLRDVYHDARLHFVLVCGARGCPAIASFAYVPERLDQQMESQTKLALNNPDFVRVNDSLKSVAISQIFQWYSADFTVEGRNVLYFINQYRTVMIPEDYSLSYYDYDWSLNDVQRLPPGEDPADFQSGLQTYTPSVMLGSGECEYKFFNNLYTQTSGFDADGNRIEYHTRSTYFSSINQFLVGISPRLNVGADIWIKSVRVDSEGSSPFSLLKFERSVNTRTAISGIGPKIKVAPFRRLTHLSVQSTLLIPVSRDQEGTENGKPYLSADRFFLITQIFYDKTIGTRFQLFFQLAPWMSINKKIETNSMNVATPADVFLSWFPTPRLTIYVQNEFWPSYSRTGINSWFRQEGLGAKFQIVPGLIEAEILYTIFTMGKNAGAGQTFNFGIRIIR